MWRHSPEGKAYVKRYAEENRERRNAKARERYAQDRAKVQQRQARYLCSDKSKSHTGYPMKQLDEAYDALERAVIARRKWKARAK